MSKDWVYILIIFLFSLIGMKALFHPGLFTAHDIWHQVVRFYYYSQAINDGQIPPYWISQLAKGFGYPFFLFSYHLPWIIGILFLKIGFNITSTIKVLFFISFLTSGITMYFFAHCILKDRLSALLSALLYLWLPYHFLIIFVSASIGIAFVFTFLPLIFWGICLIREKSRFGISVLALGLAGIILSHIMHLIFLLPIILSFAIWGFSQINQKVNYVKNLVIAIILAILMSSFYLIPATYYNQFTRVHQEEEITKLYERNFITLSQLIYSRWGFAPIVNNAKNGEISFQLGIAQWISLISLCLLIILKKLSKAHQALSIYLVLATIVNIFLMLDNSASVWKFLVRFVSIDFPFRLILPTAFIGSLGAGILLVTIKKNFKIPVFIFLIFVAVYTNRNHLNVNQYTAFTLFSYLDLETEITTNTFNEYLPINANPKLLNKPWNEIRGDNLSVYNLTHTTNLLSFDLDVPYKQSVSLGQFYFPGQTLYLDSKINQFSINTDGLISFEIPTGTHNIAVKYQETLLIKISKILTLVGILIVFKKKACF